MPAAVCTFSQLSMSFAEQPLFSALSGTLCRKLSGLVGRNGQGKSVLLKILAGQIRPTQGHANWTSPFALLDQLQRLPGPRIAEALGVAPLYDCFARIERGAGTPEDLIQVAESWHLPAEWQRLLHSAGLDGDVAAPVDALSGGQQTRLALCALFLQQDCYLLLDEPTNHLDAEGRIWLGERLREHRAGALVVSHDRQLLLQVDTLFELSSHGLREFGGNYALYQTVRQAEIAASERHVSDLEKTIRHKKQRQQDALQQAAERRRQGEKQRHSGSQPKILLDRQKGRAEQSLSRLKQQHAQTNDALTGQRLLHQQRIEHISAQKMPISNQGLRGGLRLHLQELVLPWGMASPISLQIYAGERWHICGRNGSGKSTLLKVISGALAPTAGACYVHGHCLYLDQHFSLLDSSLSAAEALHRLHPDTSMTDWRTRLGDVRLRRDKALLPIGTLSGGEQLKVALLAITSGNPLPDMLLLDEPENHLDLDSRLVLEEALASYRGALLLVSHDREFVQQCGVNNRFDLSL